MNYVQNNPITNFHILGIPETITKVEPSNSILLTHWLTLLFNYA